MGAPVLLVSDAHSDPFRDAVGIAETLDEPVVVVAHGRDAALAVALAAVAPDRVRALVLVAPQVGDAALRWTDRLLAARFIGPGLTWSAFRAAGVALSVPWLRRRILGGRFGLADADARWAVRQLRRGGAWRVFVTEQRYLLIDAHLGQYQLDRLRCPVTVLGPPGRTGVRPGHV